VDHVTRNTVYHVAMFGGSNGFWQDPFEIPVEFQVDPIEIPVEL
jgi:hypothetical protein